MITMFNRLPSQFRGMILCSLAATGATVATAQTSLPDYGPAFLQDEVATFKLELAPDDLDSLLFGETDQASSELMPATMHYLATGIDDTLQDVGVRLRGNTSLTAPKKSFKLDLNAVDPGQDFYGLEKLNLNANQNDPSLMRAALTWRIVRELGLAGSRTSFVRFEMNDNYMGAYVHTEHFDEEFIDAYYAKDDGNLYKCLWPATLHHLGADPDLYKFEVGGRRAYELKTNTEADDYTDLAAFIDVLNNASDDNFKCAIEQVFNVADYLKVLALDVLTGNWDGYAGNKNNFYLYQNPQTGLFDYIPYDLDNTWGLDWVGQDWASENPYDWAVETDFGGDNRPLYDRILAFEEYRSWYTYYLRKISEEWFNAAYAEPYIEAQLALLDSPVADDAYFPLSFGFTTSDFANSASQAWGGHVEYGLNDWVAERTATIQGQLDPEVDVLILHELEDDAPSTDSLRIRAIAEASGTTSALQLVAWVDAGDGSGAQPYPMFDDGEHGDRQAGDGTWGIKVPVLPGWISVDYQVQATAGTLERWLPCSPRTATVGNVPSNLLINELMSRNSGVYADELWEYDDWCELYNAGNQPIELGGKYLTDNVGNPSKFALPPGELAPGDWVLFWLDNDPEQGNHHADFSLSGSGEELALFEAEGDQWQLLDLIIFGASEENISLGRLTDGNPQWVWFATPTPDYSNNSAIVLGTERLVDLDLSVWPNPAIGQEIRLSAPRTGELLDAQGRSVLSFNAASRITVSPLPAGSYYLRTARGEVLRIIKLNAR